MKANIGISEENKKKVVDLLNVVLADEFLLYTKTLNFHWNLTGHSFAEIHEFLDKQYHQMQEMIDSVAERIRQVGGFSAGSLNEFLKLGRLKEVPGKRAPTDVILKNLLVDHETIITHLRKDLKLCDEKYGDMGTSDFLTGLMELHEKMAWMIRSYSE